MTGGDDPVPETMTLIGGRSSRQGTSLCVGKLEAEYIEVSSTVEMNADDMARLGLKDNDRVRLRSASGDAIVRCKTRPAKELPSGLLFIAYGPLSSRLMGSDTAGSGMPISKNIEVQVEAVVESAEREDAPSSPSSGSAVSG